MTPTRREYCWKCRGMVTAEETGADDAYACPKCGSITREPRNGESRTRPIWDIAPVSVPARTAASLPGGRYVSVAR